MHNNNRQLAVFFSGLILSSSAWASYNDQYLRVGEKWTIAHAKFAKGRSLTVGCVSNDHSDNIISTPEVLSIDIGADINGTISVLGNDGASIVVHCNQ